MKKILIFSILIFTVNFIFSQKIEIKEGQTYEASNYIANFYYYNQSVYQLDDKNEIIDLYEFTDLTTKKKTSFPSPVKIKKTYNSSKEKYNWLQIEDKFIILESKLIGKKTINFAVHQIMNKGEIEVKSIFSKELKITDNLPKDMYSFELVKSPNKKITSINLTVYEKTGFRFYYVTFDEKFQIIDSGNTFLPRAKEKGFVKQEDGMILTNNGLLFVKQKYKKENLRLPSFSDQTRLFKFSGNKLHEINITNEADEFTQEVGVFTNTLGEVSLVTFFGKKENGSHGIKYYNLKDTTAFEVSTVEFDEETMFKLTNNGGTEEEVKKAKIFNYKFSTSFINKNNEVFVVFEDILKGSLLHFIGDIVIFKFDNKGSLLWNSIIEKNQRVYPSVNKGSFNYILTENHIHLIFNDNIIDYKNNLYVEPKLRPNITTFENFSPLQHGIALASVDLKNGEYKRELFYQYTNLDYISKIKTMHCDDENHCIFNRIQINKKEKIIQSIQIK